MRLIDLFKAEVAKRGEVTLDHVMQALCVVENEVKYASNDEIMEFGDYFLKNYDELTSEERLKLNHGYEPISIGTYKFIKSTAMDEAYWRSFGRQFSKREEFELNAFKKELKMYYETYSTFIMTKKLVLAGTTFENYFFVAPIPNFDIMRDEMIDTFVRNAMIAELGTITIILRDEEDIVYYFADGHWTSKKGRKF